MSPCICAGVCLCGAILGYVLHNYCQRSEINFTELAFAELAFAELDSAEPDPAEINFKEVECIKTTTIRNKATDSVV